MDVALHQRVAVATLRPFGLWSVFGAKPAFDPVPFGSVLRVTRAHHRKLNRQSPFVGTKSVFGGGRPTKRGMITARK